MVSEPQKRNKIVYIAMRGDFIHPGHLNIIEQGSKYGDIVIGLMTDKAISSYKRLPLLSYEQREIIVKNIKNVSQVIPQTTLDYTDNLKKIMPDYVAHGDDWRFGVQKKIRDNVIKTLSKWGGELLEFPYSKDISSSTIEDARAEIGTTPDVRRKLLRRLIKNKDIVRIMEAHNGLTGLIVEKTKVNVDGVVRQYDGIWISSLTQSTSKGKPDTELDDLTSRIKEVNDISEVTTKPIIYDGDTGGLPEHFYYMVRTLERLGVSAVIIEDKVGLKKNSLFGTDVLQHQDDIDNFCNKIEIGKKAQVTKDFMIIARIESLILNKGMGDALQRAEAYAKSGADAIMIHSKSKDGAEIIEFCKKYNQTETPIPIVVVPTAYSSITEQELQDVGVNIVIYANHLIRSAYPAMVNVAQTILKHQRAKEVEELCMPIKEILTLIPSR